MAQQRNPGSLHPELNLTSINTTRKGLRKKQRAGQFAKKYSYSTSVRRKVSFIEKLLPGQKKFTAYIL